MTNDSIEITEAQANTKRVGIIVNLVVIQNHAVKCDQFCEKKWYRDSDCGVDCACCYDESRC